MTLRLKINLLVGALTLLFVLALLAVQWRNLKASVLEEVVAANRVATLLLTRTAAREAMPGTQAMLDFLQGTGRVRSNDITLLDAQGRELYRSPSSTYKAGRDAPAWFAAQIQPVASEQTIVLPDQGRLLLRANASRAVLDAWDDLVQGAGLALALLLLVNGAVFWLVGRTVRPFSRIVTAMAQVEGGRFDVALPALPGREAAAIGHAFNAMVGRLASHIEAERRAALAEAQLERSRELTRWIDQRLEQERRQIARELHDEFGQSVVALRSMSLSLAQRLTPTDVAAAETARTMADEALRLYDAMHDVIPRLAPLVLDSLGLHAALGELVERTRASHAGVEIAWQVALDPSASLDPEVALVLYRAAQEGLTNAMQHGHATRVALTVKTDATGQAWLQLVDNGQGLPSEGWLRAGHYGLRWLQERVEGLRGTLRVTAATGPHGTADRPGVTLAIALPPRGAATQDAMPAAIMFGETATQGRPQVQPQERA